MNVNHMIRCVRMQKGISAAHVARRLKMDRSQYCHLEKGRRRVTVNMLVDLATILDVDVRIFFDDKVVETKSFDVQEVRNETAI